MHLGYGPSSDLLLLNLRLSPDRSFTYSLLESDRNSLTLATRVGCLIANKLRFY